MHSNARSPSPLSRRICTPHTHTHTDITSSQPRLPCSLFVRRCLFSLFFRLVLCGHLPHLVATAQPVSPSQRERETPTHIHILCCNRVSEWVFIFQLVRCSHHRPSSAVPPPAPPTAPLPLSLASCSSFLRHLPSPSLPLTLLLCTHKFYTSLDLCRRRQEAHTLERRVSARECHCLCVCVCVYSYVSLSLHLLFALVFGVFPLLLLLGVPLPSLVSLIVLMFW